MTVAIRPLALDDLPGIEAYLGIRNATQPDNPDSLEHLRWEHATYPGEFALLLAEARGRHADRGGLVRPDLHAGARL